MSKFAVLFLLVGLAIGLWLGFNPQTHRQLTRFWNRTTTSQSSERPKASVDARQWDQTVNRWLRSTTKARPAPASQPDSVPTAKQISAELQTFWNALQQLWLNFVARIRTTTAS